MRHEKRLSTLEGKQPTTAPVKAVFVCGVEKTANGPRTLPPSFAYLIGNSESQVLGELNESAVDFERRVDAMI